ncbi:protein FAM186A [Hippopotamus amphibius kiboko]|uniref:protein FAM186A n=1 Tax=Hippopotamus amphibius kiboko TaxID=575201 RepID=UPI00259200DA|nr:protein FAM186A [Hippopotamus amphibius kiboko]
MPTEIGSEYEAGKEVLDFTITYKNVLDRSEIPKLEIPFTVQDVITRIEQAQLHRAKEDINMKLGNIMQNVQQIINRYTMDENMHSGRKISLTEYKKRRAGLLEKIVACAKTAEVKEKTLAYILAWLGEWNVILSEMTAVDIDERHHCRAQMEMLPETFKAIESNVKLLSKFSTSLLEEKKKQKKKTASRGSLWKSWKERVIKRPATAHALRPDQMISDQFAANTKVSEIQDMLQELIGTAMFNKLENNAIKYISSTTVNLSKALSTLKEEMKVINLQSADMYTSETSEKEISMKIIQDLSKKNEMLQQKLQVAEEKYEQLIQSKGVEQQALPTSTLKVLPEPSPQSAISQADTEDNMDNILAKEFENIDEAPKKGTKALGIKWDLSLSYTAQAETIPDLIDQQYPLPENNQKKSSEEITEEITEDKISVKKGGDFQEDGTDQYQLQKEKHTKGPFGQETSESNVNDDKGKQKVSGTKLDHHFESQTLEKKRKEIKFFPEAKSKSLTESKSQHFPSDTKSQGGKSGTSSLWERLRKAKPEYSHSKSHISSENKEELTTESTDKEDRSEMSSREEPSSLSQLDYSSEKMRMKKKKHQISPGATTSKEEKTEEKDMSVFTKKGKSLELVKSQSRITRETSRIPDSKSEQSNLEEFQKAIVSFLKEKIDNIGKPLDKKTVSKGELLLKRAEVEKLGIIKAKMEEYFQKVAENVTKVLRKYKDIKNVGQFGEKPMKQKKVVSFMPELHFQKQISAKSEISTLLSQENLDPLTDNLIQMILTEIESERDVPVASTVGKDHKDKEKQRLEERSYETINKSLEKEEAWLPVKEGKQGQQKQKQWQEEEVWKGQQKQRMKKQTELDEKQKQREEEKEGHQKSKQQQLEAWKQKMKDKGVPLEKEKRQQVMQVQKEVGHLVQESSWEREEEKQKPRRRIEDYEKQKQETAKEMKTFEKLEQVLSQTSMTLSSRWRSIPKDALHLHQRKEFNGNLKKLENQADGKHPIPITPPISIQSSSPGAFSLSGQSPTKSITLTPQQAQAVEIDLTHEEAKAPGITHSSYQVQALGEIPTPKMSQGLEAAHIPEQAQAQGITLIPQQAKALGIILTPEQAQGQVVTLTPQQAQALGITLTPQQAQALGTCVAPELAQTLGVTLTPQQAQALGVTLTPQQAQALGVTLTPQQAQAQGITLTPQQAQTLGVTLTPQQAQAQGVTLTPQQAQTLGVTLTPQQAQAQGVTLTPQQAQAQGVTLTPQQAQALGITLTPQQAQALGVTLTPQQAQTLGVTLTPQQAQAQGVTLTPQQAQALGITLTPQQAQAQGVTLTPQQAQTLGVTLTPQQAQAQGITLTPQQAQAQGITLTPQQAQAQGITLTPELAQAQGVTLTPQQAQAQGITLTPQQAQAQGVTLTPQQAQAQGITLTPQQAQAQGVTLTPQQAQAQGITLTPKQAQALGVTLTPQQAQALGIPVTLQQALDLGAPFSLGQAQALEVSLSPEQFKELEIPLTSDKAYTLDSPHIPEQIQPLGAPFTPGEAQSTGITLRSKQDLKSRVPLIIEQPSLPWARPPSRRTPKVGIFSMTDKSVTTHAPHIPKQFPGSSAPTAKKSPIFEVFSTFFQVSKFPLTQAPFAPGKSLGMRVPSDPGKLLALQTFPSSRQTPVSKGQSTSVQFPTPVPSPASGPSPTPGQPLISRVPATSAQIPSIQAPLSPGKHLVPGASSIPGGLLESGPLTLSKQPQAFQTSATHEQSPYLQAPSTLRQHLPLQTLPGQDSPLQITPTPGHPPTLGAPSTPGKPPNDLSSPVSKKSKERLSITSSLKPKSALVHPSAPSFKVHQAPFTTKKFQTSEVSDTSEEIQRPRDLSAMEQFRTFKSYLTDYRTPVSQTPYIDEGALPALIKPVTSLPPLPTQLPKTSKSSPSEWDQKSRLPPVDKSWTLTSDTKKPNMMRPTSHPQELKEQNYFVDVEAQRKHLMLLNQATKVSTLPSQLHTTARNLIIETPHMDKVRLVYLFRKYIAYRLIQRARNNIIKRLQAIQNTGRGCETQRLYIMLSRIDDYQKKVMQIWTEKQKSLQQKRNQCLRKMMYLFSQLQEIYKLNLNQPIPLIIKKKQISAPTKFVQQPFLKLLKEEDKKYDIFNKSRQEDQMEAIWNADLSTSSYPITEKTSMYSLWTQLGGYPDIPMLLQLDVQSTFGRSLTCIQSKFKKIPK